jgi:hypothetical protein
MGNFHRALFFTTVCETRLHLLEDYQLAVDRYIDAIRHLRLQSGVCSKAEYQALLRGTEALRSATDAARKALMAHHCELCEPL